MRFTLVRPCGDCPFNTNGRMQLSGPRAQEISDALLAGDKTFTCHNTIDYGQDEDDPRQGHTEKTEHCGGALIYQRRADEAGYQPNAMLQIAERLGLLDPDRLDMDAPVYTPEEFIAFHAEGDPAHRKE